MRSVDKGANPTPYAQYRDAMPYLVERIGWYCSYCEMSIVNEPDVEHVQPKSRGGAGRLLINLLLGCKKCNDIKKARNPNRNGHLWPDEDNTFAAYEYYDEIHVRAANHLVAPIDQYARNTLNLTGIDRVPGRIVNPSKKDKRDPRWQMRKVAWGKAERALNGWRRNPSMELAEQIAETAHSTGFYSIWMRFFAADLIVLTEIKSKFPNTYEPLANGAGGFTPRPNGRY
jgi:hypothetical protein